MISWVYLVIHGDGHLVGGRGHSLVGDRSNTYTIKIISNINYNNNEKNKELNTLNKGEVKKNKIEMRNFDKYVACNDINP